ncbi:MAG: hypothetical protein R3A10_20960 [Caldilineaceae bacterium]
MTLADDGSVLINGAKVIIPDVETSNAASFTSSAQCSCPVRMTERMEAPTPSIRHGSRRRLPERRHRRTGHRGGHRCRGRCRCARSRCHWRSGSERQTHRQVTPAPTVKVPRPTVDTPAADTTAATLVGQLRARFQRAADAAGN